MSFAHLGLSEEVLRAVSDAGYTEPTPIQADAIPKILIGHDILGIAQTGTGKTASFTLPMIDILARGRAKARMARSLILEPTRELAAQVAEAFEVYGKHHRLTMALLIGGVSFAEQNQKLDRGVDVLIATPGRLIDHFERGKLMLSGVQILVVDECDRMLDMGFIPDVERICRLMPQRHQTLFFSATMPDEIKRLTEQFLNDPTEIRIKSDEKPVTQGLSIVSGESKRRALTALIRMENVKNAIVFCNRKRDVDSVVKYLVREGLEAAAIHGDMVQSMRMETLDRFRRGDVTFLVASDVAARGLDIPAMSHVFNYDVPTHAEDYIHRIGRTGRAGLTGRAFTLAVPEDGKYVAAIEALIGHEIPRIAIEDIEPRSLESADGRGGRAPRGRAAQRKKAPAGGRKKAAAEERPPPPEDEGARREPKETPRPLGEDAAQKTRELKRRTQPKTKAGSSGKGAGEKKGRGKAEHAGDRSKSRQDAPVVGLGEHVPAFLTRPRRSRRSKR